MADPHGHEFSAEPAQHSSNSRQRTPYSRQIRTFSTSAIVDKYAGLAGSCLMVEPSIKRWEATR
jgi:hypothetical protein